MKEKIDFNFECTHNQAEGTMTCSWLDGRVKLVEYFKLGTTYVLIDDVVKNTIYAATVKEFMQLQQQCQEAAKTLANM